MEESELDETPIAGRQARKHSLLIHQIVRVKSARVIESFSADADLYAHL